METAIVLTGLKIMLELYNPPLSVQVIGSKGRFELQHVNSVKEFNFKRATYLEAQGNGIYFIPPTSSKVIFLDDFDYNKFNRLPAHTVIVQTSSNSYQCHIPLPSGFKGSAPELQKAMVRLYQSDIGASGFLQPRRLPGFINQKYTDKPIVNIVDYEPDIDINIVLEQVRIFYKKQLLKQRITFKTSGGISRKPRKHWGDFAINNDKSLTDMRYAKYLLMFCRLRDENVRQTLLDESPDIQTRKRNLEDYLFRTIKKARLT